MRGWTTPGSMAIRSGGQKWGVTVAKMELIPAKTAVITARGL